MHLNSQGLITSTIDNLARFLGFLFCYIVDLLLNQVSVSLTPWAYLGQGHRGQRRLHYLYPEQEACKGVDTNAKSPFGLKGASVLFKQWKLD